MPENSHVSGPLRASYTVLFAVSGAGPAGVTVDDLAVRTGMHPRTVYRHLRALRELGMVEPASTPGRYRTGAATAGLAVRAADQLTFLMRAQEAVDEVTQRTLEPAHVTVHDHGTSTTVAVAGDAVSRTTSVVPIVLGSRRPAHASASGKVFLAHNDAARTAYLLRPLESFTPFTIADRDRFLDECRAVRAAGHATDTQENTLGVSYVAVPVHDLRGRVTASIVVSSASGRMPGSRRQELLDVLHPAAERFSRSLGGAR